jgi:hypothetical protein
MGELDVPAGLSLFQSHCTVLLYGGPRDGQVLRASPDAELPPTFDRIIGEVPLTGGLYELVHHDVELTDFGPERRSAQYRWRSSPGGNHG